MRSTTAVRSCAGVLRNQMSGKYAGQMGFVKSGRAAEPPIPLLTIDATEPAEPQPQGGRYRWSEAGLWAWEDLNLGLILIRTVRGMRSCWSSGDGQLMGGARVTVVVRWAPGLSVFCGTRVAREDERGLALPASSATRVAGWPGLMTTWCWRMLCLGGARGRPARDGPARSTDAAGRPPFILCG